jgi:hypothetical protein
MASNKFNVKVYPSGFAGSADVEQTKPLDIKEVANALMNVSVIREQNPHTASVNIIELWLESISGVNTKNNTFEFKERILKAALVAFGTTTFLEWINIQINDNPSFGDNHYAWLNETILYVYGGKPRQMSFNNWLMLLNSNSTRYDGEKYSNIIKAYIFNEKVTNLPSLLYDTTTRENDDIPNLILNWVRQPGGINDLLASLNVLFGRR